MAPVTARVFAVRPTADRFSTDPPIGCSDVQMGSLSSMGSCDDCLAEEPPPLPRQSKSQIWQGKLVKFGRPPVSPPPGLQRSNSIPESSPSRSQSSPPNPSRRSSESALPSSARDSSMRDSCHRRVATLKRRESAQHDELIPSMLVWGAVGSEPTPCHNRLGHPKLAVSTTGAYLGAHLSSAAVALPPMAARTRSTSRRLPPGGVQLPPRGSHPSPPCRLEATTTTSRARPRSVPTWGAPPTGSSIRQRPSCRTGSPLWSPC